MHPSSPSPICGLAMALLAAACQAREKTLASLDGPVKVELRFLKGGVMGRGATVDRGELFVTVSGGERRRAAHCFGPSPELAGDGTAHRFAYRCRPAEPWTAVYVSPHELFTACSKRLGAGPVPAWRSAPAEWVDAGPELLTVCAERPWDANVPRMLHRELASMSEERALVFLTATRDFDDDATRRSDWTEAARKLSPAGRKKLGLSD